MNRKKNNLRFVFPVNQPGLGDRFIMTSNILYARKEVEHECCIIDIFLKNIKPSKDYEFDQKQYLNLTDFYDIIDFFHFKRPDKSEPLIISNIIDEEPPPFHASTGHRNIEYEITNNEYKRSHNFLYNREQYWPINYDKTIKKDIITFMFYVDDSLPEHKFITVEEEKEFQLLKTNLSSFNFHRLEDFNFKKNVELLSRSKLLISSEGMWTHLSRAMDIDTITISRDSKFIKEFTRQGYFCSGIQECLNELEKRCHESQV